jgi:hypothetical protein
MQNWIYAGSKMDKDLLILDPFFLNLYFEIKSTFKCMSKGI